MKTGPELSNRGRPKSCSIHKAECKCGRRGDGTHILPSSDKTWAGRRAHPLRDGCGRRPGPDRRSAESLRCGGKSPRAPRLSGPSLPPPTQSRSPDQVLGPGLAAGPPRSAREASLCRDARGLARPAPRSRAAARTHRARSSAAAGRRFLARRAGSGGGGASGSGVSGGSGQRGSQRRPGAEPSPERSPGPSPRPRPAAARRGRRAGGEFSWQAGNAPALIGAFAPRGAPFKRHQILGPSSTCISSG